jgi:CMP-N-acetylneuraminic acid synthetase
MKTIAVIPARGGSKGVPKKNIADLAGFPLLYYSINIALQVFGKAYVSTDCDEIATIARSFGAQVIKRPEELASDTATDYDWLKHVISVVECENVAILRPTTPLRCAQDVLKGLELFESNSVCTSMRSAHEAPESPYKWFEKEYEGKYWKKNPLADMPRQALPKIYIPNGYLDITRRETIEKGSAYGEKILSFITEPVVEVDTQEALDYLEYVIKK